MNVEASQAECRSNRRFDVQQVLHSAGYPEEHGGRRHSRVAAALVQLLHLPALVLVRMRKTALNSQRQTVYRFPARLSYFEWQPPVERTELLERARG